MNLYDFRPRSVKRHSSRRVMPIFWKSWTQPRVRLFRRQLAAARYATALQYHYYPEEREESDYAR